jgi:hypothetical protein
MLLATVTLTLQRVAQHHGGYDTVYYYLLNQGVIKIFNKQVCIIISLILFLVWSSLVLEVTHIVLWVDQAYGTLYTLSWTAPKGACRCQVMRRIV